LDRKKGVHREWLQGAVKSCYDLLDLNVNWDGYGAQPVARNVIDDVVQFLKTMSVGLSFPDIDPAASNEVLCTWRRADRDVLLVSFYGDTLCHYYANISGDEHFGDDIELNAFAIDSKLEELIKFF
jgi:hypothetical protein